MEAVADAYHKLAAQYRPASSLPDTISSEGIEDCSLDFALCFCSGVGSFLKQVGREAFEKFATRSVAKALIANEGKIQKATQIFKGAKKDGKELTEAERRGFKGIRGKLELNTPKGMGRNHDTIINGKKYWGHALDRMQDRGIPLSAVENCIKTGKRVTSKKDPLCWECHDAMNNIKVVTKKETGDVVSVMFGAMK